MTDSELRSRRRLRDAGLDRLRRYTTRAVVGALGLAGLISVLAASSVPGRVSTSSAANAGVQPPAQSSDTSQVDPFQQSTSQTQSPTYVGSGGGSPWAVSGGS